MEGFGRHRPVPLGHKDVRGRRLFALHAPQRAYLVALHRVDRTQALPTGLAIRAAHDIQHTVRYTELSPARSPDFDHSRTLPQGDGRTRLGSQAAHAREQAPPATAEERNATGGAHQLLKRCVAYLHHSSSKRRLQITTGIDRAPRPTQPDFATWDCVRGSIARPRIRVWGSQRAPSSQPLHWGRGVKSVARIGRSRGSAVDRDDDVRSFDQRSSPMARWRTALLGSAAAVAMLAGEPARAISINDQAAAAAV